MSAARLVIVVIIATFVSHGILFPERRVGDGTLGDKNPGLKNTDDPNNEFDERYDRGLIKVGPEKYRGDFPAGFGEAYNDYV